MKARKVTKWISRITTALLFVVLFAMIFLVIAERAGGGNLFGYQLKTVLSGSMEPNIQTGSVIAVQSVKDGTHFQKGDIVTFKTKDHNLVTHRIYKVNNDGKQYITKGDNNDAPDQKPLLADNIVAEYTGFTIPYVGYPIHYASTKLGTALLLILPGLFLMAYSGITIWRSLKEVDQKEQKASVTENQ